MSIANGYLNGSVQWMAAAIAGFTLGRKRVPVMALVGCTALLTLLQLGKVEYRSIYWEGSQAVTRPMWVSLADRYSFWFGAGLSNLWCYESTGETSRNSMANVLNPS